MKYKLIQDKYVIRLEKGEELVKTLSEFCASNKIIFGYFYGVGAVSKAELAHYSLETKEYYSKIIEEPLEICSLSGNVALFEGRIAIHAHVVVSDREMKTYGGHIKEAVISATCEIFLKRINSEVDRSYSKEIGLNLFDF